MITRYSDTQVTITTHTLTESSLWEISQIPTPTTSTSPNKILILQTQFQMMARHQQLKADTPNCACGAAVIIIIIIFILLTRRPKQPVNLTYLNCDSSKPSHHPYTSDNPGIITAKGYENPEVNEDAANAATPKTKNATHVFFLP